MNQNNVPKTEAELEEWMKKIVSISIVIQLMEMRFMKAMDLIIMVEDLFGIIGNEVKKEI